MLGENRVQDHHGDDDLRFAFAHIQLAEGTLLGVPHQVVVGLQLRGPNLDLHLGFKTNPCPILQNLSPRTTRLPQQRYNIDLLSFQQNPDSSKTSPSRL